MKREELEAVRKNIEENMVCPLKDSATNIVFGKGNADAEILFIGEAPGEKEDLQGIPFVGSAGKQLDGLLSSIGLTLDDCYVANILKYRPPNNRDPTVEEIKRHTPYLIEQIRIIKPRVICTLGNFSTKFVLANFEVAGMKAIGGISGLHGTFREVEANGYKVKVVPLYHPAAMLYNPRLRDVLAEDFKKLGEFLGTKREEPEGLDKWM
jgi:DNA polymerase